ncbi:MAG: hypothetical protein A2X24_05105 [Chloroflexi bacterium GWB2_54_36]|nr:MAG: hypothetical protein A2X24_05105 [Chloroflexi bacterium GWB2_54_36]HBA92103.1 hypothetical protein [Anaerolineaceae bacterium]
MNIDLSPSNSESQLLSPDEVAKRLEINPSYAKKIMERGLVPTVRKGEAIFVRKCDLDEGLIFRSSGDVLDKDGNPIIWTLYRANRERTNSH